MDEVDKEAAKLLPCHAEPIDDECNAETGYCSRCSRRSAVATALRKRDALVEHWRAQYELLAADGKQKEASIERLRAVFNSIAPASNSRAYEGLLATGQVPIDKDAEIDRLEHDAVYHRVKVEDQKEEIERLKSEKSLDELAFSRELGVLRREIEQLKSKLFDYQSENLKFSRTENELRAEIQQLNERVKNQAETIKSQREQIDHLKNDPPSFLLDCNHCGARVRKAEVKPQP